MPERFNLCVLPRTPSAGRVDALERLSAHLPFPTQGPASVLLQNPDSNTWSEIPWLKAGPLIDGRGGEGQLVTVYFPMASDQRLSVTIERASGAEAWVVSIPGGLVLEPEVLARGIFDWSRAMLGECIIVGGPELEVELHPSESATLDTALRSDLLAIAVLDSRHQLMRSASETIALSLPGWRLLRFSSTS